VKRSIQALRVQAPDRFARIRCPGVDDGAGHRGPCRSSCAVRL